MVERGVYCIFGGTGFVGRHLTRALCSAGGRVRIMSRKGERPAEAPVEVEDLRHGAAWKNYLRLSLYGDRKLNFVSVENVAAALIFLADTNLPSRDELFILSDDDEDGNSYRHLVKAVVDRFPVALPHVPL